MKKILVAIIAIVLVLALFGCGGDKSAPEEEPAATDAVEMESEEAEPADTAEEASDADSGLLSPEFKKTMDDYEAWFDHYCEVMKKYQDNPSDLELMSEMTDLLTEETTMLEQMENMDQSQMNSAELAYYIEVTARIEKKLLEVANY
jgi:hypothetical protein